mgnify:FL=1
MRLGTGYSALLIAILWILAGIFVIDFGFHLGGGPLQPFQLAIIIVLGIAALVWAAMRFTAPFLGKKETEIDMALLVERQQKIDSDLVAALQFEGDQHGEWGSRQLEDAVVDYVAQFDRGLNVFEGISHEQFWRRLGILAVTILISVGLIAMFPAHAQSFFLRLAMDNVHYPSKTQIERVLVNGDESLSRLQHGTAPQQVSAVQGSPTVFAAWVDGAIPSTGTIKVYTDGGQRELEMTKVDRKQLQSTVQRLEGHVLGKETPAKQSLNGLTSGERGEAARLIASLTGLDITKVQPALENTDQHDPVLTTAWKQLKQLDDAWGNEEGASDEEGETSEQASPSGETKSQLFVGKLPRLLDPAEYKISLGDAWTDPASIEMISLPVVQPKFTETPPKYAEIGETEANDPAALQRSVIEGSRLELAIESTKPLEEAVFTIIATEEGQARRTDYQLTRQGETLSSGGQRWTLDSDGTPLGQVTEPLRFEIQVTDSDGLSLPSPLRGALRLKADRPPRISGSLVHRVVLPNALPEVELRVDDDYGIDSMNVHVSVLRGEEGSDVTDAANEASFAIDELLALRGNKSPAAAAARLENKTILKYPLQGDALPRVGAYVLDLSSLSLQRGDEVRIVLEAIDHRGKPGVSTESEPIILEITDESGILAAVSEGDRRSQEQIDDLIRRQLGIGETPRP